MATCSACGHENRDEARFCDACGASLAAGASGREERKVVTVLFADLVGFTSRAEQLDPEDVRALLSPYYSHLREELEHFGGTVEKFIGDAVMALFGAPTAHEDDPERAVRAALAIRDWVGDEEVELQLRIAVNTGEALIALGARPAQGEGMASGDVVNTAARLQSAAPVNGVLVGESTYRATRHVIDYREAEPVDAKGKSEPLRVWEAVSARSRVGSEAVSTRAPLIGRTRELDQLVGAFERACQARSTQHVTLVGVPGIGKSRLVTELLAHVDSLEEIVYWRHGRSLPYGEGAAFWALGEMVKAQAGILESDEPQEVARKLEETVAQHVEEAERSWVEGRLRPLVGLGGDKETGGSREESFSAWRRFLESLAERRPLVLVFEDLHWAGDELLDFVDELPEWVEDAPLLVLCTARPELLDRRPGWGGGKRNALTISLPPLASNETAQLIAALLDRSVLPAETQAELLQRAGGNPLYAEQFARMLAEGGTVGDALPESVQGIIAARLDSLAAEEKRLLQDAAVLGKVFWAGSLAAVTGSERATVEQHLRTLGRKEFVRRERHSSVEGELEYAFNHVLVRDVAYGQIPRSERAAKHRRAAEWIESLGRADDQVELVAHHYLSALELAQASGGATGDLAERARTAVRAAGAQALALHAYAAAARSFELAAGLAGDPDPGRPRALLQHGLALKALNDERRFAMLEEAESALMAAGDTNGAAEAAVGLTEAWWHAGESARCTACLDRAAALVRGTEESATSALVLGSVARFRGLFGDEKTALEVARASLRLAEALGQDELRAMNLITIGTAGFHVPDADFEQAFTDIRAGLALALAVGDLPQAARGYANLGSLSNELGDLAATEEAALECYRIAAQQGHVSGTRFAGGNLLDLALSMGKWPEAETRALEFLTESGTSRHYMDGIAFNTLALVTLAADRVEEARAYADRTIEFGREIVDPQAKIPCLATGAFVQAELGERDSARALVAEVEPGTIIATYPALFFAASSVGAADELRERVRRFARGTRWDRAAAAVLDERWVDAADAYEEIGATPFAAFAALRATRSLVAERRRVEADRELRRALAFFRSVGAARYVREGESLLAASA
jgi:class 3 adenylate cyclase/DNA-binding transcriptional ArsR family regulator